MFIIEKKATLENDICQQDPDPKPFKEITSADKRLIPLEWFSY